MASASIQDAQQATPFQPFVLHLADGREIPVDNRDTLKSTPNERTIVVMKAEDRINIIDPLLVTELEFKPIEQNDWKVKNPK